MTDEIIKEVRAVKDAIAKKYNYDIRKLFEEIKRGESELQVKGIALVAPPSDPANMPTSALQRSRYQQR